MSEIKDLGFGVIEIFDKDTRYAPAQSIKIGNNTYIREDLINKQIADLQHRLEVTEKALNEMSNYAINDNDLYDLVSDFNIENERYDEDHFGIDTCDVVDYFKEQVEKEVKGE